MNSPSPISFLKLAIQMVPAAKYAVGVGAVFAVVAIITSFGVNVWALGVGVVAIFVLMPVFVIFTRIAAESEEVRSEPTFRNQTLVFVWFCLGLIMAAALALFFSLFWNWPINFAVVVGHSRQVALGNQASKLVRNRPSKGDTWLAYETDYVRLTDIVRNYVFYIEQNPDADVKDEVFRSIEKAAKDVRRWNQDVSAFADKRSDPVFYSKMLPDVLDHILGQLKIAKHNGDGLTLEDAVCFDTVIKRWRASAWFDDEATKKLRDDSGFNGQPPEMSKRCTDYLLLQPQAMPYSQQIPMKSGD